MRKLMLLAAMLAVMLLAAAPAIAQEPPSAKVTEDVNAKGGPMPEAKAGGATAKGGPCPEAKAGDIEAKGGCKPPPPPPPPPPKMEAKAEAPKMLPPTGGAGVASLLGLGAGALLVGGGLLARRIVRR